MPDTLLGSEQAPEALGPTLLPPPSQGPQAKAAPSIPRAGTAQRHLPSTETWRGAVCEGGKVGRACRATHSPGGLSRLPGAEVVLGSPHCSPARRPHGRHLLSLEADRTQPVGASAWRRPLLRHARRAGTWAPSLALCREQRGRVRAAGGGAPRAASRAEAAAVRLQAWHFLTGGHGLTPSLSHSTSTSGHTGHLGIPTSPVRQALEEFGTL